MQRWLEEGYRQFALDGPNNLSINKMSEEIGVSRASFYHHFGDLEIFKEQLLLLHLKIVQEFDEAGKSCKRLFPDFYELISQYPIPLQFSMQLFHHRDVPEYNMLFMKTYEGSAYAFLLKLFSEQYAIDKPASEIYSLWLAVGEVWYARLTKDDLSASTLQAHGEEIMEAVLKFSQTQLYSSLSFSK